MSQEPIEDHDFSESEKQKKEEKEEEKEEETEDSVAQEGEKQTAS